MRATRDDGGLLNVLIVIDEPGFRNALDSFLRSESLTPVVATSIAEAASLTPQAAFDLIFVSETLDALSAEEISDTVRSVPGWKHARVVAVSQSRAPSLKMLYTAGFDAVVGPASTAEEIIAQAILAERSRRSVDEPVEPEASDAVETASGDDERDVAAEAETAALVEPVHDDALVVGPGTDSPAILSDRARDILATLKTLGFYLSHAAPAERLARHALHAVDILYPGVPSAIWLRPSDDRGLVLVPGSNLPAEYPEMAHPYYANLTGAEWDALSGGPCFIAREHGITGPLVSLFEIPSIHGALHLGLVSSDCLLGLLALYVPTDDGPDTHDIIALETIASMTAVAMAHAVDEPVDAEQYPDAQVNTERPWQLVFEQLPDAAFLIDASGQFLAANAAMSSLSGISTDGLNLLSIFDVLDDRDVDVVRNRLASIIERDSTEPEWLRVGIRRDGEYIVAMHLILRRLPTGAWDGETVIQGIARDAPHDTRGTAQLASLEDIARIVAVERDAEAAIHGLLKSLSTRLGYPRAAVWSIASNHSTLRRIASLTDDVPETLPVDEGIAGRVFRSWQPELVTDLSSDQRRADGTLPAGSIACVPIEHGDRILGVLQIQSDALHPMTERDLRFFMPIAAQIAGIIERDQLYRHLEHQAMTDLVTQLPNRQAFQQWLDRAVETLEGGVVSVLVLGVDGFKDINELYGHVIADDVLRQIGVELQAHMSPGHLLARYTSDQFAILLPGIDRDDAVNAAEHLRIAVATHLFTVAEQVEHLTVSIGAATCPDDAKTSQAVLQAADHAMYLAKRAGRNQTFQSNAAFATLAPAHGRINDLLRQSPRETLSLLIRAMDQRLPERAGHSERVTRYALAIARELGVPESELPRLRLAAYIHDIGMVSLPDALLRKPSQLSPQERGLLRGVPVAAHGLLSQLDMHESVLLSVLHQRENYDGSGYPSGLAGESIPLGARIIAVADALDAMTSPRAHREPMTLELALEQVSQQAGGQFDPSVVRAAYCLSNVISEPVTVSAPAETE